MNNTINETGILIEITLMLLLMNISVLNENIFFFRWEVVEIFHLNLFNLSQQNLSNIHRNDVATIFFYADKLYSQIHSSEFSVSLICKRVFTHNDNNNNDLLWLWNSSIMMNKLLILITIHASCVFLQTAKKAQSYKSEVSRI